MMRVVLAVFTALGLCLAAGCGDDSGGGGDKSCAALCSKAQNNPAGSCTTIKGDCGKFCTAMDAVQGPANCTSQRNAYQSCVSAPAHPCDASCSSQESALSTCVGVYCLTHSSDANCQTLLASFQ